MLPFIDRESASTARSTHTLRGSAGFPPGPPAEGGPDVSVPPIWVKWEDTRTRAVIQVTATKAIIQDTKTSAITP